MATKKSGGNDKTVNRSSESGRFVTDKYVKSHPKTTETEHRPSGGGSKNSGPKKK